MAYSQHQEKVLSLKKKMEIKTPAGNMAAKIGNKGDEAEYIANEAEYIANEAEYIAAFDNPYFDELPERAEAMFKAGEVSYQDALDYVLVHKLKKNGLWAMNKQDAEQLWKRKFITETQANAYVEYHKMQTETAMTDGQFILDMLARGWTQEEIHGELGGLIQPWLDPTELMIDILTGGWTAVARGATRQGWKQGSKMILREMGKDAAFGAGAISAMWAADEMGGGKIAQILSGLLTPLGASVLMTASKTQLKHWAKSVRNQNPQLKDQLIKVLDEAPESEAITLLKKELQGEAEEVIETAGKNIPATAEDIQKSLTIMDTIRKGNVDVEAESEFTLVNRIREKGDVEATDVIEAVRKELEPEIDKARGGKPNAEGVRVDWTQQQKEAEKELRKMADFTGQRVSDMKKMVGWGKNLEEAVKTARRQTRAFNQVFSQYADEIKKLVDDAFEANHFTKELEALEHIRLFGEMTKSVYGVRSEWGRALQSYQMPWMKTKFDFEAIPGEELRKLEKTQRSNVRAALTAFKRAKSNRTRALRARNYLKDRWLLGMLEFEQAALLSHPLTQAVNITGNMATLTFKNIARRATTHVDAWIAAGAWRRPFTRDQKLLRANHLQNVALKRALVESFRLPKEHMTDVYRTAREAGQTRLKSFGEAVMDMDGSGTFWKALWSGEGQLDQFVKYAEESKGAIPNIGKIPVGDVIRMPFKGLTAGDEIFKTLNYRMELYELAHRKAIEAGISLENLDKAVELHVKNPTPEMEMHALRAARQETFTNELDQFTGGIERALNAPYIGPVLRMSFVPFYKITVNLPKYALKQTPLGLLAKEQREILLGKKMELPNGTTQRVGNRKARIELMSRWALGMSLMTAGLIGYEEGWITGRVPTRKRRSAELANVQPYSFVNPDTGEQYDYSRIEPAAYLIGMAADIGRANDMMQDYLLPEEQQQAELELHDVTLAYLTAFTAPILEKSVARSLKDAVQLAVEPEKQNWEKLGIKQVEKFMPRIINFASELTGNQKEMYEARSVMEAWYRKWGSIVDERSQAYPKRHLVYGTVVPREERAFSLVNKKTYTDDPILQEMWQIGFEIKPIEDELSIMTQNVELTFEDYEEIQKSIEASQVKEHLAQIIKNEGYQQMEHHSEKVKMLKSIVQAHREAAIWKFLSKRPDIMDSVKTEMLYDAEAMIGVRKQYDKDAAFNYWSERFRNN
jgi:hypothetical protein